MNDDPTASSPEALDDLALRRVTGDLSDAEHAQVTACMACPHSPLIKLVREHQEIAAALVTAMLPACPPPAPEVKERIMAAIQPPPPEVKARIMAAIQPPPAAAPTPVTADLSSFFLMGHEQHWDSTPYPGVRTRLMSSSAPEFTVLMVEVDAGATFPSHDHVGSEDVYVLSGDAIIQGRHMRAGDFMHSEAGTRHDDMISPGGCRAILITARKNYSPVLGRAYGIAHRVAHKLRAVISGE
jgi:anti-sigma factor ChrR (cupin superfamily)